MLKRKTELMEAEGKGRGLSRRNEHGEWKGRILVKAKEEAKTRRGGRSGGIFRYSCVNVVTFITHLWSAMCFIKYRRC
jgi:hypothetical protein